MPRVLLESESIRHRAGDFHAILTEAGFDLVIPPDPGRLDEAVVSRFLPDIDAVIMGVGSFSRAMFALSPRLRAIARTGVGYDRIDLAAATDHQVVVTITPGANHEGVAEHTFALILGLSRYLKVHDRAVQAGIWDRTPLPLSVRGKTLGIVGLGRTGQAVASRALAFGMTVIAHTPRPKRVIHVEDVSFNELLARSDVVSLHLPLGPATQGLMNRATFARMKPGALLINTGRGGLVVEADLVEALHSGQVGGAGLDVFDPEPPRGDHPLWRCGNVLATPHLGGIDEAAVDQMARQAAANLVALYRGRWPVESVVNPHLRVGWHW